MRIGVLASHEGSVLQAVIDACVSGRIAGKVVVVVSNNSNAGALMRAADAGIATAHLSSATHVDPDTLDRAICDCLAQKRVDLVLLAGFMKKLGPETLRKFSGRIVNTHPSLLPKFGGQGYYGRRVHDAVIAAGETESGATVHWVDGDYDTGLVLAQKKVTVTSADTAESLERKVKALERELLIESLANLARNMNTRTA